MRESNPNVNLHNRHTQEDKMDDRARIQNISICTSHEERGLSYVQVEITLKVELLPSGKILRQEFGRFIYLTYICINQTANRDEKRKHNIESI